MPSGIVCSICSLSGLTRFARVVRTEIRLNPIKPLAWGSASQANKKRAFALFLFADGGTCLDLFAINVSSDFA